MANDDYLWRQVFFAPDIDNRDWKVVLKADPLSHRVDDEHNSDGPDIGAAGLAEFVCIENNLHSEPARRVASVQVATAEVEFVDAQLE